LKRLQLTFYGDKFCAGSQSFILIAMDNNVGGREPLTTEANGGQIGVDFQELSEFYSKNKAYLGIC